ncbi:alpha/beta hydrolase [Streptomyces sp. NPDC048290]|uniref:alpha/beta fold hydrolase n=1 Tax=Streptomyces sp. NPDC048290 TaxID=3155811 RepID=UPI0034240C54
MSTLTLNQARFLDLDDGRIAYYETGGGDHTIVWVHGLPLDSRSWAAQQDFFDPRARNVFLDLRGYGASDKLPASASSVTALYVSDLAALIRHLGLDRPMVVGFASAGHVALRFAAQHPALLGRLAVINGSPRFLTGPDWPYGFQEPTIERFTALAAHGGIEALTDALLDPKVVFADVPQRRAEDLGAWFREMSRQAGVDTLLGFFESIARDDDRALLPRITVPTLLLASALGQEVPTGVARWMRDTIPDARLAELPGADHFAFATRPEAVNHLLDTFLTTPGPA